MIPFREGDEVKVVGLPSSQWLDARGVIVKIVQRQNGDDMLQECAVEFPAGRCWFMSRHLVRAKQDRFAQLVRSEALDRWKDLSEGDIAFLTGNREEIIRFLQDRYGLRWSRAKSEADQLLTALQERLTNATDHKSALCSSPEPLNATAA